MEIAKWGNSLAVRLPDTMVAALQLKEGDTVELQLVGARQFGVRHKPGRDALLRRLRAFRGRLPAGFRLGRDATDAR